MKLRKQKMSLTEKSNIDMVEDTTHANADKARISSNVAENIAAVGEPPNPWGKGLKRLYLYCAFIYLCSTMNGRFLPSCLLPKTLTLAGFDGSLMGSINAIPEYQDYYHLGKDGAASTGLVFSIFQIGQMVGALFTWICDWQGRKLPIFGGCLGVVISSIITAVAPNRKSNAGTIGNLLTDQVPTFIGGRFLLSFCSTIATVAAPLYLVEIAPPLYRGTVAGSEPLLPNFE